ncbi:hypothetical protein LJB87_03130, partial [Alistipes sp. OttesenSCG-928-L06]|nr:hypothetical protein [Alistipes sp. OttesenSCG-928-L06]
MKSKRIILTGAGCLLLGVAAAQTPIQREVDVTRAYEPSVQNALKLNIMPDMTDTTQVRPDFVYEITPRPLNYGFAVNPLNPARIAAVGDPVRFPFYAKVGIGFPMQSVADVRYTRELNDRMNAGAYLNHYGRWAKIENDMKIKEKATYSDNKAGAFLDFRAADDFVISGNLDYRYRNVNRYGYSTPNSVIPAQPSFNTSDEAMKQWVQDVGLQLAMGHSFTDLNKLNVKVNAGINYFSDRFKYNQLGWNIGAWFGFRAGADGTLLIGTEHTGSNGQSNFKHYSGLLGRAGATYRFDNGDFRVKVGAYFGFTETKYERPGSDDGDNFKGRFLPEISLEKDLFYGAMTPFLDIRGEIIDNSYRALADRNPYLYSGQYAQNTVSYNGRAGIKGALGGSFKYAVYGGYTTQQNAAFWANAYSGYNSPANGASYPFFGNAGNVFTVLTDDLNYFEAGVEFQANIRNAVTLNGGFNYYGYSPDTFDEAWGMPEIKAHFDASYNHRNKF